MNSLNTINIDVMIKRNNNIKEKCNVIQSKVNQIKSKLKGGK